MREKHWAMPCRCQTCVAGDIYPGPLKQVGAHALCQLLDLVLMSNAAVI